MKKKVVYLVFLGQVSALEVVLASVSRFLSVRCAMLVAPLVLSQFCGLSKSARGAVSLSFKVRSLPTSSTHSVGGSFVMLSKTWRYFCHIDLPIDCVCKLGC